MIEQTNIINLQKKLLFLILIIILSLHIFNGERKERENKQTNKQKIKKRKRKQTGFDWQKYQQAEAQKCWLVNKMVFQIEGE